MLNVVRCLRCRWLCVGLNWMSLCLIGCLFVMFVIWVYCWICLIVLIRFCLLFSGVLLCCFCVVFCVSVVIVEVFWLGRV